MAWISAGFEGGLRVLAVVDSVRHPFGLPGASAVLISRYVSKTSQAPHPYPDFRRTRCAPHRHSHNRSNLVLGFCNPRRQALRLRDLLDAYLLVRTLATLGPRLLPVLPRF